MVPNFIFNYFCFILLILVNDPIVHVHVPVHGKGGRCDRSVTKCHNGSKLVTGLNIH